MNKNYPYNKFKELVLFRAEVIKERDVLNNVLSKLDVQINALQIEQLHLSNLIKEKQNTKEVPKNTYEQSSTQTNSDQVIKQKPLDLSIPNLMVVTEEESEDDDDNKMITELANILENEMDD